MKGNLGSQIFSTHTLAAASIVVTIMIAATISVGARFRKPAQAEDLAPIPTPLGICGRRLYRFEHGDCIVLRQPVKLFIDEDRLRYSGTDEDNELVRQQMPISDRWYTDPNQPEEQTTFNCATFAIGDVIELDRHDFLTPESVSFTNYQNPVDVLLREFYYEVESYSLESVDWKQLERLDSLEENDVVVFGYRNRNDSFAHLGKIQKLNGRNRMISKMGQGPIVRGTLQATADVFSGSFEEIRIYRRVSR